MSDQTSREQQAEILDEIAEADIALSIIQPHNAVVFNDRIKALEAGAAALRAPVRPQENEEKDHGAGLIDANDTGHGDTLPRPNFGVTTVPGTATAAPGTTTGVSDDPLVGARDASVKMSELGREVNTDPLASSRQLLTVQRRLSDGVVFINDATFSDAQARRILADLLELIPADGNQGATQSSVPNRGSEAQKKDSPNNLAPPASSPETPE